MTDSVSKQSAMIEHCLWQLAQKGHTADDAYFFTSLEPSNDRFRPEFRELAATNTDLAEMIPRGTVVAAIEPSTAISNDGSGGMGLESLIDEGTGGMGVMLYYGELEHSASPKFDILNHCIACLQTVHHKGSAIIKLTDSTTFFDASLAFLLYQLFEEVTVTKPYASDFSTTD